ncbi:hypothetical protein TWF506_004675 [Arthrobotrys conoides]|uniref:Uncharacterized protein n=1 Tax=Arthrobotrys conoides TaxID=74498 RepID=A0AAN8NJB0_9PEZI
MAMEGCSWWCSRCRKYHYDNTHLPHAHVNTHPDNHYSEPDSRRAVDPKRHSNGTSAIDLWLGSQPTLGAPVPWASPDPYTGLAPFSTPPVSQSHHQPFNYPNQYQAIDRNSSNSTLQLQHNFSFQESSLHDSPGTFADPKFEPLPTQVGFASGYYQPGPIDVLASGASGPDTTVGPNEKRTWENLVAELKYELSAVLPQSSIKRPRALKDFSRQIGLSDLIISEDVDSPSPQSVHHGAQLPDNSRLYLACCRHDECTHHYWGVCKKKVGDNLYQKHQKIHHGIWAQDRSVNTRYIVLGPYLKTAVWLFFQCHPNYTTQARA